MSKTFQLVTELEFDHLLQATNGWGKDKQGSELVYTHRVRSALDIQIKVYSSIVEAKGTGRGVGQDAIRVCAVNTALNHGLVKCSRVNRVPGWEKRLKDRVIETIKLAKTRNNWK